MRNCLMKNRQLLLCCFWRHKLQRIYQKYLMASRSFTNNSSLFIFKITGYKNICYFNYVLKTFDVEYIDFIYHHVLFVFVPDEVIVDYEVLTFVISTASLYFFGFSCDNGSGCFVLFLSISGRPSSSTCRPSNNTSFFNLSTSS